MIVIECNKEVTWLVLVSCLAYFEKNWHPHLNLFMQQIRTVLMTKVPCKMAKIRWFIQIQL